MSTISESAFVVQSEGDQWWIRPQGSSSPDGPYATEQDAIDAAIDQAKTIGKAGDDAEVLVQRGDAAPAKVWP